jgi:hypothetical protein
MAALFPPAGLDLGQRKTMLRRTKIILAAYCLGGVSVLALAVCLVIEMTRPREGEDHHHHHFQEPSGPETSPAETYTRDGRTYMKASLVEDDFDVTQSCVELGQILQANLDPEKFPHLEELRFVSAEEAAGLPEDDAVVGVCIKGEEKAYPMRMLNHHVVFNDLCGGSEIAVVWDILTLTPKVFSRRLERSDSPELVLTFDRLGLLHRGGLLLYDKPTRSLWWPPEGKCLAGQCSGSFLEDYPFMLVTWSVWKKRHPGTAVVSTDTPFSTLYRSKAYEGYYELSQLPVPVEGWDGERSPFRWSEPVIALERGGKAKAYPFSVLGTVEGIVTDTFAGSEILIHEAQSPLPYPTDADGGEIPYSFGAWFLWSVRYPDIEVFSPQKEAK